MSIREIGCTNCGRIFTGKNVDKVEIKAGGLNSTRETICEICKLRDEINDYKVHAAKAEGELNSLLRQIGELPASEKEPIEPEPVEEAEEGEYKEYRVE